MARYIDADEILNRLPDDLPYKASVKRVLIQAPDADVVSKSEEGAKCPTCHGTGRIGTTDWLTKNISKEQLAKEKAEAIAEHELHIKQDYAREIFEEIEECMSYFEDDDDGYLLKKCEFEYFMRELEKKYMEGKE